MPKDYDDFLQTLDGDVPDGTWSEALKALWYDAKGNWHTAHEIADGINETSAKWVHAYLHRKEGDDWNARYWYRQAGKTFPTITLDQEREKMVRFLLSN